MITFFYFSILFSLSFTYMVKAYLSEFRPYILGLMSLTTLILSKFKSKFEDFIDPLFWLTQNIDSIVERRQENNVNQ
jgi:hypothetical protein